MTEVGYQINVPGKLMIAGEYAVLEPYQRAIVTAVNRYVTAHIEPSSENKLYLPQLELEGITWKINNQGITFSVANERLGFIQNAMTVAYGFLKENSVSLRPFNLHIDSQLDDPVTGRKYGLGSSAAVVVAVIAAIVQHHSKGQLMTQDDLFKLSIIAHLKTQGSGSGADIAAAVYGGWVEYAAFRGEWVLDQLDQGVPLRAMLNKSWPNLFIKPLTPPTDLQLLVGWTKEPAATGPMIKQFKDFRNDNIDDYNIFLEESAASVAWLVQSFEDNDCDGAIESLIKNRRALQKLDEKSGMTIETPKLVALGSIAETFGSGKSSGAGGGDCGIAFIKGDAKKQALYQDWQSAGIKPLNMRVSPQGMTIKEKTN